MHTPRPRWVISCLDAVKPGCPLYPPKAAAAPTPSSYVLGRLLRTTEKYIRAKAASNTPPTIKIKVVTIAQFSSAGPYNVRHRSYRREWRSSGRGKGRDQFGRDEGIPLAHLIEGGWLLCLPADGGFHVLSQRIEIVF